MQRSQRRGASTTIILALAVGTAAGGIAGCDSEAVGRPNTVHDRQTGSAPLVGFEFETSIAMPGEPVEATVVFQSAADVPSNVDYELRTCDLHLTNCRRSIGSAEDRWDISSGTEGSTATFEFTPPESEGYYLYRVRGVDAIGNDRVFTSLVMVSQYPMVNPDLEPSGIAIRNFGENAGASMTYANIGSSHHHKDGDQDPCNDVSQADGYTRIDIEANLARCGREDAVTAWRFTKTQPEAYWGPGRTRTKSLRWCMESNASISTGMETGDYNFDIDPNDAVSNPAPEGGHRFVDDVPNPLSFLGSYGAPQQGSNWPKAKDNADIMYALLPPAQAVPRDLPILPYSNDRQLDTAGTWIARTASARGTEGIHTWYMEAFAPNPGKPAVGAALVMRYVELGVDFKAVDGDQEAIETAISWTVVEDWYWRPDGLVSKIVRHRPVSTTCSMGPSNECRTTLEDQRCLDGTSHETPTQRQDINMIEWFDPQNEGPLHLELVAQRRDGTTIRDDQAVQISHAAINGERERYGVYVDQRERGEVDRADASRPLTYSGFLEVRMRYPNGVVKEMTWRAGGKPVFAAFGEVLFDPERYGASPRALDSADGSSNGQFRAWLQVRPLATTSNISADSPLSKNSAENLANNNLFGHDGIPWGEPRIPWSNEVELVIADL